MISTSPKLERQLFPKPVGTWTPDDWATFFVTAQKLVDNYGKEHVLALVNELVLAEWLTPSGIPLDSAARYHR
jgi:hypothetical protein